MEVENAAGAAIAIDMALRAVAPQIDLTVMVRREFS